MRINRIYLKGFGRWIDKEFCFPNGLSFWSGPNEAGKTTLVQAVLAGLYGLAKRRTALREIQDRYRPWRHDAPFGVTLDIEHNGIKYRIDRDFLLDNARAFRWDGEDVLPEKDPDQLVVELVGLHSPLLFLSTLLIAQGEVSDIQEGKPGEAIAKKVAAAEADASVMDALRWLERELGGLVREGRTENTQSTLQHAKLEQAKWAALLGEMDASAEREEALENQLQSMTARLQELEEYRRTYAPLLQQFDELQTVNKAWEEKRRALEEALRDHAWIEKNRLRWETAQSQWEAFEKRSELAPERRQMVMELETDLRLVREQWSVLNQRLVRLDEELGDMRQMMTHIKETDGVQPSWDGWIRYLEQVEQLRAARVQFNEVKKLHDEWLQRTSHWKWLASAMGGVLILAAALVGWKFLFYAMLWLILPGVGLIFLSGYQAKKHRRSVETIKRLETEWRQQVEKVQSFEEAIRKILQGHSPEHYQMAAENQRDQAKGQLELSGRIAALTGERDRLSLDANILAEKVEILQIRWNEVMERAQTQDKEGYFSACLTYDRAAEEERAARAAWRQSLRGKSEDEWESAIAKLTADCHIIAMKRDAMQFNGDNLDIEHHRQQLAKIDEELPQLAQEREVLRERRRHFRESYADKDRYEVAAALNYWQDECIDLEHRAEGVRLAITTLEQAAQTISHRLTPLLITRSGELFSRLTNSKYRAIRLVEPGNLRDEFHVQVQMGSALEEWVEPEALSSGARDQLYFALRIALGEYLTGRTDFPLILDDPFVHFDPERLEAAVALLHELESRHQILWLTKDPELGSILFNGAQRGLILG